MKSGSVMFSTETVIGQRGSENGHLHTGSFPEIGGRDYVPEGRDRLGFQHWRGYNFHTDYFGGTVNLDDWRNEKWEGYETDALNRYAFQFMDDVDDDTPFCLFISRIKRTRHLTSLLHRNTMTGYPPNSSSLKMFQIRSETNP